MRTVTLTGRSSSACLFNLVISVSTSVRERPDQRIVSEKMRGLLVCVLAGLVSGSLGLYSKGDAVIDLTPANFDSKVLKNELQSAR